MPGYFQWRHLFIWATHDAIMLTGPTKPATRRMGPLTRSSTRHGGLGAVAAICRDSLGAFQGPSAVAFANMDDPEVLEALAIRETMALSEDLYVQKIAIASDCKKVVEAIKTGTSAAYGAIVHEIKSVLGFFLPVGLAMNLESLM